MRRSARFGVMALMMFAASGLVGFAQSAESQGSRFGSTWTYGAEFDFNSRYIWRSLAWSEGAVWQPSVWLGTSGLTLSVWSNFVLNKELNYRQFNEVDYRLSYKKEIGKFSIEPAFNIYSYPNQDQTENPTTGELEILASFSLGDFSLETAHFVDLVDNPGGYIGEFGLAFEKDMSETLTVNAAARLTLANAKFNEYYIPFRYAAVNAFVLELGLNYSFGDAFYVRPHFEWNELLDPSLRSAVRDSAWVAVGKSSLVNFGLAVGVEY
jgi:hypothetical protein